MIVNTKYAQEYKDWRDPAIFWLTAVKSTKTDKLSVGQISALSELFLIIDHILHG